MVTRAVNPGEPFGWKEYEAAAASLLERYPFIQYEKIGRSVLDRELGAFQIGRGTREIHYSGGMHANEWITSLALMAFLEELAEAEAQDGQLQGQQVRPLLDSVSLWITPQMNPDGAELVIRGLPAEPAVAERLLEWNGGRRDFQGWKANANGVDLNDQFPAHWEKERARRDAAGPGPRDYTGDAPLTEPEAVALARFTTSHSFQLLIALHTQGREIYWNYRDLEPPESIVWAECFRKASGYIPVKLEGSDAGYKDWFIQEFGKPGFTVEAGFGVNPLPLCEFGSLYQEVEAILLEGMKEREK